MPLLLLSLLGCAAASALCSSFCCCLPLCQAKGLLRELEDVSSKLAASARDHADKSKALQQRVVKLVRRVGRSQGGHKAQLKPGL